MFPIFFSTYFLNRFRRKRRVAHKDPLKEDSESGSYQSSEDLSMHDDDEEYHNTEYKFEIPSFVAATRMVPPSTHVWTREDTLPHIRKARLAKEKDMLPTSDNLAYLNKFCHEASIPEERPPSYDKITPPMEKQPDVASQKSSNLADRPSTSAQADAFDKASQGVRTPSVSSAALSDEQSETSPESTNNATSSKGMSETSEGTSKGASIETSGTKPVKKGRKRRSKGKPYVPLSKRLPKPVKPKIYKSNQPLKVNKSKLQEKLNEIAKQNEDKMYNPHGEVWRSLVTKIFPQDLSKNESDC